LIGTWYENRYPGCACDIVSQAIAFYKSSVAEFLAIGQLSVFMALEARLDELVSDLISGYAAGRLTHTYSYSSAQEFLAYFKEIVAKYNLEKFVKLNHRVIGAWWNEETGKWKIKVQPGNELDKAFFDEGDILINATGLLK
jgi:cation diffusion facilitator CzcD-associated flavoprotein CzcO